MASIVIVDDRVTNRRILSRLAAELETRPDVETFGDPVLALDWLEHNEPDLVVTDYKMPHLDGAEFVESMRRLPTCEDVPVIVVTAYEDKGFRYNALNAGATDFLLSPVDHQEFRARARNLLTLRCQQSLLKRRALQLQDRLELNNRLHKTALKEGNEKLRLVMNTIPAMINATDTEHRYVFMNNFQAWMLGVDPEDIVGKSAAALMEQEYTERHHRLDRQVFESGVSIPAFEEEFFDATGRRRILLTTKSPLRDGDGAVANVVSASVEISDRKAAELALEDQRQFLREVIDLDPNIIFSTSQAGIITLANAAMAKLCGITADQLIGRALLNAVPVSAEAEIFQSDGQQVLQGGMNKLHTERQLTDSAGDVHFFQVVNVAIELGRTRTPAALTVGSDISAIKKSQLEMDKAKQAAEISDLGKSEFLAHVSHELRTPLNAIVRHCEMISSPPTGPASQPNRGKIAEDIGANARHLLGLVDDIVDVSNYEAGKYTLFDQELNVGAIIRDIAHQVELEVSDDPVQLRIEIAADMPALIADPLRFRQGMLNLLANAVKFTPPGGKVLVRALLTEQGAVRISVQDQNKAVNKHDGPLMLNRFGQVENGMNRSYPGSGLDLPLSVAFMKMHDAELDLCSREGEGSEVTITFPAMRSAWEQEACTQ
ncbi:MAG: PAS domain S-box protein [Rhodospirillaceae bacterium]|nr:PAS domain S-box protein [Rhodospirillaceae bacterium]